MEKTPLEYAKLACDALMHQYKPERLPPEGVFFYHQGVFLSGMQRVYEQCGEKKYFQYVKDYVDSVLGPEGEVAGFCHELPEENMHPLAQSALLRLDNRQPVILLYQLYRETGEEKYWRAIVTISESMYYWPVNGYGGYWHMMDQPNQMWMDGAYMAGPLSVMYSAVTGNSVLRERAIKQVFLMNDYMKDEKTGLYYHGWDASVKKERWADPVTGLSGQFWGRAVGWYAVAVMDILDGIPADHPAAERLERIERELLEAVAAFQDGETGMWYEVLDRPDREDNWVESSCTNLFIYACAAALQRRILDEKYAEMMERAYGGILRSLSRDREGYLVINDVCEGTCIDEGTYEHYISRSRVQNDLHGAGAFILMCTRLQEWLDSRP